jgi:hypothetical protein
MQGDTFPRRQRNTFPPQAGSHAPIPGFPETFSDLSPLIHVVGNDSVIQFDANDSVTVDL